MPGSLKYLRRIPRGGLSSPYATAIYDGSVYNKPKFYAGYWWVPTYSGNVVKFPDNLSSMSVVTVPSIVAESDPQIHCIVEGSSGTIMLATEWDALWSTPTTNIINFGTLQKISTTGLTNVYSERIRFLNGYYYLCGQLMSDETAGIWRASGSDPGTWTRMYTGPAGYECRDIAYSSILSYFCACAENFSTGVSIIVSNPVSLPTNWATRFTLTTARITGITNGGGHFVASTDDPTKYLYSASATSWGNSLTMTGPGEGIEFLGSSYRIYGAGNAAQGGNSAVFSFANGGSTPTRTTIQSYDQLTGISDGGSTNPYLLTGSGGLIASSSNGSTFALKYANGQVNDFVTSGSRMFVVSSNRSFDTGVGKVLYSDDNGATWLRSVVTTVETRHRYMKYSSVQGKYVLVGDEGCFMSPTGNTGTWTQSIYNLNFNNVNGLAEGTTGGFILAVTGSGYIHRFASGVWTEMNHGLTFNYLSIAATPTLAIATAYEGLMKYSTNGINWYDVATGTTSSFAGVAANPNTGVFITTTMQDQGECQVSTTNPPSFTSVSFGDGKLQSSAPTYSGGYFFLDLYDPALDKTFAHYSVDGVTWTSTGVSSRGSANTYKYNNGILYQCPSEVVRKITWAP